MVALHICISMTSVHEVPVYQDKNKFTVTFDSNEKELLISCIVEHSNEDSLR